MQAVARLLGLLVVATVLAGCDGNPTAVGSGSAAPATSSTSRSCRSEKEPDLSLLLSPSMIWPENDGSAEGPVGVVLDRASCGKAVRASTYSCVGTFPFLGPMSEDERLAWAGAQGVRSVLFNDFVGATGSSADGTVPEYNVRESVWLFGTEEQVQASDLRAAYTQCGRKLDGPGVETAYELKVSSTFGKGQVPMWFAETGRGVVAVVFDEGPWTTAQQWRVLRLALARVEDRDRSGSTG